jgi:hypothetical protein
MTQPDLARLAYEQYPALLDLLVGFVRPLMTLPLAEMAAANERMQTIGLFIDPTRYRDGGGTNLTDQRKVIDAALALQRVLRSFAPAAAAEERG